MDSVLERQLYGMGPSSKTCFSMKLSGLGNGNQIYNFNWAGNEGRTYPEPVEVRFTRLLEILVVAEHSLCKLQQMNSSR